VPGAISGLQSERPNVASRVAGPKDTATDFPLDLAPVLSLQALVTPNSFPPIAGIGSRTGGGPGWPDKS